MCGKKRVGFSMLMALAACGVRVAAQEAAQTGVPQPRAAGVYISTGDNHWMGHSLAVDTPASIADAFDMFKGVFGAERVYWRGLQEAAWAETFQVREESFRCAAFDRWFKHLILDQRLERVAVEIAHARGMELWGVSTIGDWGASADTPSFYDYPFHGESRLRLEHPEWAPVDKYGYRRQGGTIELAYPEARKALVDLHVRLAREAGYDGIMFLSYVENFSLRHQDEFGFSGPIVAEFKRRYGIDIRHEPFNRHASRTDWYRLRGEYLTAYLRELKAALAPHGVKLGMFLDPRTPRFPLLWATLPHTYYTLGQMYFDLETWVKEGIADELCVYGSAAPSTQKKTIDDCLWLTRGSATKVTFTTSSPLHASWDEVYRQGPESVLSLGHDESYLLRGRVPEQDASALSGGSLWRQMRFLSQVAEGRSTAETAALVPFASHTNVILRRLALTALGRMKDPSAVPALEQALLDPEVGVRCRAMSALGQNHGPQSAAKMIEALAHFDMHPMHETARNALPQIKPLPRELLAATARSHSNAVARTAAIRAIERAGAAEGDITWLAAALADPDGYAAFSAAAALSTVRGSPQAVEVLLKATASESETVANRAATSLAVIARRDEAVHRALRPQMLAALEAGFRKMGDGCARGDRDWGYRVFGDALLAFGGEGEAALRAMMRQEKDRRLSELAWRVLFLREKAGENEFNIITEKEDDEAFRQRPAWMKTNLVARLEQKFEKVTLFKPDTHGTVGSTGSTGGRWGSFGSRGPQVVPARSRDSRQAVRLVRGGDAMTGWVDAGRGIGPACDFEAHFWLCRGEGGSLTLTVRDSHGRAICPLLVNERGEVCVAGEGDVHTWHHAGLTLPTGEWVRVAVEARRGKGVYTVRAVSGDGTEQAGSRAGTLRHTGEAAQVLFVPQGAAGTHCLLDDVGLYELR